MNRITRIITIAGALMTLLPPTNGYWGQALAQGGAAAPQATDIEARLRAALDATVASERTQFPGAILYVSNPQQGTYAVAAGVADVETGARLQPDAKFRAGSIAKTFV